ncbi:MAG: sugar ABC transporter substrate-binding protein [Spirochaetales bacterium]|nr:sugar ABC transporter substrate-binding protein [Spirochaetales bacterium]
MKKILVPVLLAVMTFSLFAAGQQDAPAADEAKDVTLTFASWSVREDRFSDYFEALKADFEAANPGITIEFAGYPYGELKKQVLIMANAGQSPDLIQSERGWYSSFVDGGYVAELDALLGPEYLAEVYPAILGDMKVDGKIYGVPWIASPFVMFYNKALFAEAGLEDKAPETYEEAMMMAEKLSALTDKDGNAVYGLGQSTASVPVSGSAVLSMFFSYGGGFRDASGNIDVINEGNRAALNALKEMHAAKYNPEGAKLKDLRNLFAIGRLGMYFDTLWGIGGAYAINPDIQGSVGVTVPLSGAGSPAGSSLEAHMLLVAEDSPNKEAAAEFIKFATSPEQMGKYVDIAPFLFPKANQVDGNPGYKSNPGIAPVLGYADTIRSIEKNPEMENVFLAMTTAAQSVTVGGMTADQALANLDKELKTLLK